jgi:hypothetical protein
MLNRPAIAFAVLCAVNTVGMARDESAGIALPSPAVQGAQFGRITVTTDWTSTTITSVVQQVSRSVVSFSWTLAPFSWVPMDADERDPTFSELELRTSEGAATLRRAASAVLDGAEISEALANAGLDPVTTLLGDISLLPSAPVSPALTPYFRNIDGTMFPLWHAKATIAGEVTVRPKHDISYRYRLRPAFFQSINDWPPSVTRLRQTCRLDERASSAMKQALLGGGLVCIYKIPLPPTRSLIQLQSESREVPGKVAFACTDQEGAARTIAASSTSLPLVFHKGKEIRLLSASKEGRCE